MLRTVEAVVEPDGSVRLLEPISVPAACRALVTILNEPPTRATLTALVSEDALADWGRPEEDVAWQHLQTGADLVGFWEREGVIGSRPDIADPAEHARHLRADATSRSRLRRKS